jgi:RNA polymerase II subunit A C-terminal domain phosphatase SSU72
VKIASVCAMNNNRSMACHYTLKSKGISVTSYGTSQKVKLPGATEHDINEYDFGTPYAAMMQQLSEKDPETYRRNGLLSVLERNASIKDHPERFQDTNFWSNPDIISDIIICFELKVFDAVVEDLNRRGSLLMRPVHVLNLETRDTLTEGNIGGLRVKALLDKLDESFAGERQGSWQHFLQEKLEKVLEEFEGEYSYEDVRYQLMYF